MQCTQISFNTIWPKSNKQLRNRFFNEGSKKRKREDDSCSTKVNSSNNNDNFSYILNSFNGPTISSSSDLNDIYTSGVSSSSSNADFIASKISILDICVRNSGGILKVGVEFITKSIWSTHYLKHFKEFKRDGAELAAAWQRYFKNQKDTPSKWYLEFKKNL